MKRHQRASFPALSSWVLIHFQRFMSALYKFQTERQISMPKCGEIPLVLQKKLRLGPSGMTLHSIRTVAQVSVIRPRSNMGGQILNCLSPPDRRFAGRILSLIAIGTT